MRLCQYGVIFQLLSSSVWHCVFNFPFNFACGHVFRVITNEWSNPNDWNLSHRLPETTTFVTLMSPDEFLSSILKILFVILLFSLVN